MRIASCAALVRSLAACSGNSGSGSSTGGSGGSSGSSGSSGSTGGTSGGAVDSGFTGEWAAAQGWTTRATGVQGALEIQQTTQGCDLGADDPASSLALDLADEGGLRVPGAYDFDAGQLQGTFSPSFSRSWTVVGGRVQLDAFDPDGGTGQRVGGTVLSWSYVRGSYDLVFGWPDGGAVGEVQATFESLDCH